MEGFTQTPLNSPINITPSRSKRIFKWLVVLAVGLGVASILLFFFGDSSFTESRVLLQLEGPTQAAVGDEVIYKVKYENRTKAVLEHVRLDFTYPEGSVIVADGKIINHTGNVISSEQEDLRPGESRELEFHAFLVGDRGSIKTAQVKLYYDPDNTRSPFEKTAQLSTTITSVPVALTLAGPPTSVSGQSVTYTLDYRNQSQDDISGLQIVVEYPDGFTPNKMSPNPSTGNTTWELPTLKKGEGKRIRIQGPLTGREGESKQVSVSLKRNIDGSYVDYQKTSVTTVISSPLLSLQTFVNDSADYTSHAGDKLQYEIRYQNSSNFTFTGLTLTTKLEGNMYDLATLDTQGGFYDPSTRTITWNSTAVSAFNSLSPRASGIVKFSVKLKPSISGGGSGSLFARAIIQLYTTNVPDVIEADKIMVSDDVITKITSQPSFKQTMYYNDPAFGSSGPMPPQAGKETLFTVHWQLINPGNELSNAKVVGTLPQGVTWKNVISVGSGQPQPTFNRNTSQVVWNLGALPAGVGTNGAAVYELSFQISVKPSSTQVGQAMTVLTNAALSGADSFTKQNIVVNGSDLTTNSTVDRSGQGIVQ